MFDEGIFFEGWGESARGSGGRGRAGSQEDIGSRSSKRVEMPRGHREALPEAVLIQEPHREALPEAVLIHVPIPRRFWERC